VAAQGAGVAQRVHLRVGVDRSRSCRHPVVDCR
jgi:hypothetical protein